MKVEKRTTLRARWTRGDTTERYFEVRPEEDSQELTPTVRPRRWVRMPFRKPLLLDLAVPEVGRGRVGRFRGAGSLCGQASMCLRKGKALPIKVCRDRRFHLSEFRGSFRLSAQVRLATEYMPGW